MKYIFFTFEGLSLPIAWRLLNDGEEVYVCQVEDLLIPGKKEEAEAKRRRMSQYDGLIKKHTPSKMLKAMQSISNKDNYFVFFDFNNLYKYADIVQKMGFRNGLFPTEFDFKMEADRDMAQNFIKEHYPDVKTAERIEFKNIQDAINFINQSDKIWVLKGNSDDAKTVVPENNEVETAREILVSALNEFKKEYESKGFILVEKIINPKEITPMIVFNNGEVIFTDIDIEAKLRDAGDVGVQVGAALSLVVRTNPLDEINKIAFPQIVYDMAKQRKGLFVWDLSLLIDENDNIYGGEYCFSEDTEVLTENGWKNYKEIIVGEMVMSINPRTREMEWKPITKILVKKHKGEMINIKTINALVTPDHQFWMDNDKEMKRFRAKELPHSFNWKIPRTGIWNGKDIPEIIIPELDIVIPERVVKKGMWTKNNSEKVINTHSGKRFYSVGVSRVKSFISRTLPQLKFKTEDLCYLLGLFLSEGSFGGYYKGEPRAINIAQSIKNPKRVEIENRLKKMNLKFSVRKDGAFEVSNRQLAKYFWDELGLKNTHAESKFIPKFFKELSPKYLYELLMGYMIGDGHYHKNQWVCSTISKKLADDLQEIIHKIGLAADIKIKKTKGTTFTINGKTYQRRHDAYVLSTRHQKTFTRAYKRDVSVEFYDGIVWDVSVADNESLMVRRNGKVFFSSNCPMRFGWDSAFAEMSMSNGKLFEKIASSQNPLDKKFGVAIRIFNEHFDAVKGLKDGQKIVIPDEIKNETYVYEMKYEKELVSTNYSADLAVITASDNDIYKAIKFAYNNVEKFGFDGRGYRNDMLSIDYPTSILGRYNYYLQRF
jgi:hypothetical protein